MRPSGALVYDGPNGVSGIIESIIHIEIRRPYVFDGDHDDLKQEMRMAAIRAMEKYDASRIGPSPYKFFQQCVRNHLYNLHRGIHVPNNPPCVRCEFWDSVNKTCKIDEVGCDAILKYRDSMKLKQAIRNPGQLPEFDLTTPSGDEQIAAFLLNQSIQSILPPELLNDYNLLVSGHFVESRKKIKIRKIIRQFLEDEDAS